MVLSTAAGIFCVVGGVEPQSETVWRQSEKYGIAKIAFINKLDRPGANFENVLDSMRLRLGVKPLLLQLPVGQGREFTGILDLLKMEKLVFHQADKGSSWTTERLTEEEPGDDGGLGLPTDPGHGPHPGGHSHGPVTATALRRHHNPYHGGSWPPDGQGD